MAKQTIAVDLDDVLAVNVPSFLEYSNKNWDTNLTLEDYDEDWQKMWGVDLAERERRAVEVHESGLVSSHKRIDEAERVLRKLATKYRLVIITSRRMSIQIETLRWIDKHFDGIFEDIRFAGIWDTVTEHANSATKAELCRELGADFLIDDQPKHCIAVAEAGLQGLLFGEYPWNVLNQLPERVARVKDWQEVEAYFDGIA